MLMNESDLRSIIRNEVISESIKNRVLSTLLIALVPIMMSGQNYTQTKKDRITAELTQYVEKRCADENIDISNPEHSDRVRVIVLDAMRGGFNRAINRFETPAPKDPTSTFRR